MEIYWFQGNLSGESDEGRKEERSDMLGAASILLIICQDVEDPVNITV